MLQHEQNLVYKVADLIPQQWGPWWKIIPFFETCFVYLKPFPPHFHVNDPLSMDLSSDLFCSSRWSLKMAYLWRSLSTLYLLACPVTQTDSGLCCCVPCYTRDVCQMSAVKTPFVCGVLKAGFQHTAKPTHLQTLWGPQSTDCWC